jgi:diaminopimelate epimerase
MGHPGLKAAHIPTTLRSPEQQVVGALVELEHERLEVTAVNMGNPHAVVFVTEVSEYLVHETGPQLASHAAFPQGANVEFVQRVGGDRLRMRVWERGIGETWACGTGACASVVAAVLSEYVEPQAEVTVVLNGGELSVRWPSPDSQVELTGPASTVYRGELEL